MASDQIHPDKKPHEDTSISLDGLTIEQALKKAMDAGPYEPTKVPRDTSPAAPPPAPAKR
jgi:hypothetical protein